LPGTALFLRGLTGRRCGGDGGEADDMSSFVGGFGGLGMFFVDTGLEGKTDVYEGLGSIML
jgi:hypothetical protein